MSIMSIMSIIVYREPNFLVLCGRVLAAVQSVQEVSARPFFPLHSSIPKVGFPIFPPPLGGGGGGEGLYAPTVSWMS